MKHNVKYSRRLYPRIWDSDYHVLRLMRRAIEGVLTADRAGAKGEGDRTVLDYGCGDKPYQPLFESFSIAYVGADIAGSETADVQFDPGASLPYEDGTFDIVFSTQVLEHVAEVTAYLDECFRILKPGGLLLLTTHGSWFYHPHPHDYRRWTRQGLCLELEKSGLTIVSTSACVGPLAFAVQAQVFLVANMLPRIPVLGRWMRAFVSVVQNIVMLLADRLIGEDVRSNNAVVYVVEARKNTPT